VRADVQSPRFQSAASDPDACITPSARQEAMVEAARARVCAAARHGDPIDVEAAARAYGAAITLASLGRLGRRCSAIVTAVLPRARRRSASSSSATRVDA
jgi:hypothetical protein